MTEQRLSDTLDNEQVKHAKDNQLPNWLKYLKDTPIVDYTKLAKLIIDRGNLFYNENNPNGAYYNGVFWKRYPNSRGLPIKLQALVTKELVKYNISSTIRRKNAVSEIQSLLAVRFADLYDPFEVTEKTKWLVPFKNGTVNMKDLSFKPNDPNDMLMSGITNYDYPEDDKETPIFNDYTQYIFGDASHAVLEAIGYSMYRSYDMLGQPIYYIVSSGGNDKSWFANKLLIPLLGGTDNIATLSLSQIASKNRGNKFALAPLQDKLINVYMDNTTEEFIDISTLKSITGDDIQDAENKGQISFQLRSYATQWLASNDFPNVPIGNSTVRRFHFLPWSVTKVIDADEVLAMERRFPLDQLQKEFPYIAKHAIKAFHDAVQRGTLTKTKSMEHLTNEFIRTNDLFGSFLEEHTTFTSDPYAMITLKNFYSSYVKYMGDIDEEPQLEKVIKKRLQKEGYELKRARRAMGISDRSDEDSLGRYKDVIQGLTWAEND
ncbi:phage/plasmid primase, P4 family [Pediococcus pentosaceus]|uniref:phage/plasmid primase, P4 family n=1 Tax=Pediococcus pentosaceus TaxID=1255 RepID=UPI003982163B